MSKPNALAKGALACLAVAAVLGVAIAAVAETPEAGQAVAFDRTKGNCLACHTMKGGDVPSNVGPELSGMKARFPERKDLYAIIYDEETCKDHVYDEETCNSQTVMPPFGKNLILSDQEINAVIDFLYTL